MTARPRDDEGSLSVWFATAAMAMILLVGLAVDLAGQVHTQQRARDVAAQAARTGAQEVVASQAVQGQSPRVDATAASAAVHRYLSSAGVTGSVHITNGTTLVVTVSDSYHTKVLGIIGLGTMRVTGAASARLVRSEGGIER